MLKTWVPAFAGMTIFCSWSFCWSADDIDTLIENEKDTRDEWIQKADPLPPVFLWGDQTGVVLTSPLAEPSPETALCEALPFDELVELSGGSRSDEETTLDIGNPRVRELLEENCLARPGHEFTAVGPGWQQTVRVKTFSARRESLVCPTLAAYALRLEFNEQLPDSPLFFTTDDAVPDGDNLYRLLEPDNAAHAQADMRKRLTKKVPDIDEYDVGWNALHAPNVDTVYTLRRRRLDLNDDKLPNEMLLWEKDDRVEMLWVERVNVKVGSGHLRARAVLDFNADGNLDLVATGDHAGCQYELIFRGEKQGFSKLELPLKMCRCP